MVQKNEVIFSLDITSDEYENYYKGVVKDIQVTCTDGRTVRFPAGKLMSYLSHTGIQGKFILCFDQNSKFIELKKIDY